MYKRAKLLREDPQVCIMGPSCSEKSEMVLRQLTKMRRDTTPSTEPGTFPYRLVHGHSFHCQKFESHQGALRSSQSDPPQHSLALSSLSPCRGCSFCPEHPSGMPDQYLITLPVSAHTSEMSLACSGISSGLPPCLGCPSSQVSSPSLLCFFSCLGCLLNWEPPRPGTTGI